MFVHALEEVSLQFQHHKPQLRPLVHLPPTRATNKETKRPKQTHQVPIFIQVVELRNRQSKKKRKKEKYTITHFEYECHTFRRQDQRLVRRNYTSLPKF